MYNIILLGKKLDHSKSKYIHMLISKYINIKYNYTLKEIENINDFKYNFDYYIKKYNLFGMNITVPFKEKIYDLCNQFTYNSFISESVNSIKIINNKIIGNNTDGEGILFDLKRLKYISDNKIQNILIIGTGGVSKSIISKLYFNKCNIFLTGRNYNKLENIKKNFNIKNININILNINYIYGEELFDVIINATSSSMKNETPDINYKIINKKTKIYDLFYNLESETCFIKKCKKEGSLYNNDGIGMLIAQAIYSSVFWFNQQINVNYIFNKIIKIIIK